MSYVRCLRGLGSGTEYAPDTIMNLDPVDQRPVEMVLDLARLQAEKPNLEWYHPERRNLWRFGALLPLDPDDPADQPFIVSLGEGYTPQLDYTDHPLAQKGGFRLAVKDEGRAHAGYGVNPTRSFKDRGMVTTVSMAKKLGLTKLAVPTQGNAGDALSEYAHAAGLEAAIIMPDDTPMPILGKVAAYEKLYPTIHLDVVRGTIKEAGALMHEKYLPQGYFSVATFREPGWRIEGKKTMGLELAEPKNGGTTWQLPDVILYPTGGGTGVLGMWKAFDELETLGLIDARRPKMICIQSEATAPLVRAFEARAADADPVPAGQTLCTGLNVPGGVGHFQVLKIIYASDGAAVAVSETAMLAALRQVYREKGWWMSSEGAACLAALEPLLDQGLIRPNDHVVAFNTGSFEKYLPALRDHL